MARGAGATHTAVLLDGTRVPLSEREVKALLAPPFVNNLRFLQVEAGVYINRELVVRLLPGV